jgi:DNA-binding response OmpR family regulator
MLASILIVEDEIQTRKLVQHLLEREGMSVTSAGSVAEALGEVNRREFDLILLDVLLPDGNGFDACRRIRERHRMPIVILSTRRQLEDRVTGLEIGADDYVVKPFEPQELVARVRAQLRRAHELNARSHEGQIRVGTMVVDDSLRDAIVGGRGAGLTQKEYEILRLLAERAGRAVSRDVLVETLWSDDELASDKNVAVYIRRIRQKIERDPDRPEILLTVRGFGYRLEGASGS